MARYFFSLGLVPVQSWIAEARRSRDLKAGSVFLWHLMARLLAELQEPPARARIHLPPEGQPSFAELARLPFGAALEQSYGIPNRASGELEAGSDGEVRRALERLEVVVGAHWQELKKRVLVEAELKTTWHLLEGPLQEYLEATPQGEDCPLSLVWVAAPTAPDAPTEEGLELVDRLYADAKRSRPVRPWMLGGPVGKCNQCSRREAMGPTGGGFDGWRDWSRKLGELPWVARGVRIEAGERLCYVCLTRRLAAYSRAPGSERQPFASTGDVAARPWLQGIQAVEELAPHLQTVRTAQRGDLDLGRALYLSEERLEALGAGEVIAPRRKLQEAIGDQNRQRAKSGASGRPLPLRPPGYLALLAFDGDGMGRAVRRDLKEVPKRMADFARAADGLLRDAGGEIFYLGGDEGLAMVPAASGLEAARGLRGRFGELFGVWPTLSVGLAYFEHSRPMAGAIRAVQESLASAKALEGKNALGVAVETASGNRWGFARPWGADWDRIAAALGLVTEGRLAAGWAHDAERFVQSLPPEGWQRERFRAAARAEMQRLLFRRVALKEDRPEAWQKLRGDTWWEGEDWDDGSGPATELFHLIAFLARQAPGVPAAREGA